MATLWIHNWHCFKTGVRAGGRSWCQVKSIRSACASFRQAHCIKMAQQARTNTEHLKPLSVITALQQRGHCFGSDSCMLLLPRGRMHRNCSWVRGFVSEGEASGDAQPNPASEQILKDTTDSSSAQSATGGTQHSNDEQLTTQAGTGFSNSMDRHASESYVSNTQSMQTALDSGAMLKSSETRDTSCISRDASGVPTVPSDGDVALSPPAQREQQALQESDELREALSLQAQRELQALQDLPPPRPMEPSYNLAVYVTQSVVLQRLVGLGVDLSAVEKIPEAADCVVQADWERDIEPRLLFLHDLGVNPADLGTVLTKNPLLFKEDLEDMQLRVSYLQSKKFRQDQISRIVTKAPVTLLLPVKYLDKKLGFLQDKFYLTGDEVRLVATQLPKLIPWKLQKLKDLRFYVKEMLGFSDKQQKAMLLSTPRLYLSNRYQLGERFDFLHNTMGLTHYHLAAWPAVFRTRLHVLQQRHRFLLLVGRAQYDPNKENYVSLQALVSGSDHDFCANVAKATTAQFYDFQKTL